MTLLDAFARARVFDLEQPRFSGMPIHPAHQPGYFYALHRRHRDSYRPAEYGPRTGASGVLTMAEHSGTHIDALCHLRTAEGNTFWNGKPFGHSSMPQDHTGTIDFWRDGIVTRGVLYDIPRLRGTEYVAPGEPVHGWELADAAAAQGVEPRAGDAVIIRSGYAPYFAATNEPPKFGSPSGVHASCIEFLADTEAALLAWDLQDAPNADQGLAPIIPGVDISLHVHHIVLPYMGMPIVDNCELEEAAVVCAELGRWEFQFVVAPLVITRGTGSPVNPLAVF